MDPEFPLAMAACCCGFAIGSIVGILGHEMGHAVAGMLVGLEPRSIVIGRGPVLWRHRFGRTWFVFHALPVYGFAARLSETQGRRGVQAIVVAAGPIVSLLLVVAALAGLDLAMAADRFILSEVLAGAWVAPLTHLVTSLWPKTFKVKGRSGVHATDGYKLLRLARGEEVDKFRIRYDKLLRTMLDEAEASLPPSVFAPELVYQITRTDKSQAWARADMASVLSQLLDKPELSDAERLFLIRRYKLDSRDDTPGG